MAFRLLKPTTPVEFHYVSATGSRSEKDADGYDLKAVDVIIVRPCIVNTSGSRDSGDINADSFESWDAEVMWTDQEGETDTTGMRLDVIKIEGLTMYPNDELPHAMGVGGFRMGTGERRMVRASRSERGRH